METKTMLMLYARIVTGQPHVDSSITQPIGIIEKEKFHPFVESYKKKFEEFLLKNDLYFKSINVEKIEFDKHQPLLRGEITYVLDYSDKPRTHIVQVEEFIVNECIHNKNSFTV